MSSPRADPLRNLNALRNELVHHLEPTALERKVDAFVRPLRSHLSLALPPEQNALLRARTGEPGQELERRRARRQRVESEDGDGVAAAARETVLGQGNRGRCRSHAGV